jgi:hypothetical protein
MVTAIVLSLASSYIYRIRYWYIHVKRCPPFAKNAKDGAPGTGGGLAASDCGLGQFGCYLLPDQRKEVSCAAHWS